MLTSDESLETAVNCMKLGAADYMTKPFNMDEIKIVAANIIEKVNLRSEVSYLRKIYSTFFDKELIGRSEPMLKLKSMIEKIASSRVPSILVIGESGTGKELVARYLPPGHKRGIGYGGYAFYRDKLQRPAWRLFFESELFGYERVRSLMPSRTRKAYSNLQTVAQFFSMR